MKEWRDIYYDARYVRHRLKENRKRMESLGILGWDRNGRLLEAGCGGGENLKILHEEGFKELAGLDVYPAPPGSSFPGSAKYIEASAENLPFDPGSYDYVLSLHALHHLPSLESIQSFFKSAHEVLKPNGKLAILDHRNTPWFRFATFLLCHFPFTVWGRAGLVQRQFRLEKGLLDVYLSYCRNLKEILRASGFRIVSWQTDAFFFYTVGEKIERV